MESLIAGMRLTVATLLVCVAGYTGVILALAQIAVPDSAQGSLIRGKDGKIAGSRLIGQNFTQPRYFWPRPSAAGKDGYDATSAAGSNKSPTSSDLTERARKTIAQYGASATTPLPADLAAASGSGLDPHISGRAALYQAGRVAKARGLSQSEVETLIRRSAFAPGGFLTADRVVNVLELNLALDAIQNQVR